MSANDALLDAARQLDKELGALLITTTPELSAAAVAFADAVQAVATEAYDAGVASRASRHTVTVSVELDESADDLLRGAATEAYERATADLTREQQGEWWTAGFEYGKHFQRRAIVHEIQRHRLRFITQEPNYSPPLTPVSMSQSIELAVRRGTYKEN